MRKATTPQLRSNPAGDVPRVHVSAYVDPAAQVVGNVRIGAKSFIAPAAVIRADERGPTGKVQPILIGPDCNVQDGVILHALAGTRVLVGPGCSLAHRAIVHGPCKLGPGCFVGFGAVLFNATLGARVYVGAGAVVQNVRLPDRALVPPGCSLTSQDQADRLGRTGPAERAFMRRVVQANARLARGYLGLSRRPH